MKSQVFTKVEVEVVAIYLEPRGTLWDLARG